MRSFQAVLTRRSSTVARSLVSLGAVEAGSRVLEIPDGIPYDPFRTSLYTRDELIVGGLDARVERYVLDHGFRAPPAPEALAQRLHDYAIDVALAEFLQSEGEPRRVIGIMGSAATRRDDPWFRAAAQLGKLAARAGYLVASGGGPGIMEAANLGAFLARHDEAVLDAAVAELSRAPSYEDDREAYTAAAGAVRERNLPGGESLAIPTWFYPGEPVGQFASHIAKYFANSIREDGLVTIAVSGIVFAPGRSGTVQELFQDAAQNAYGIRGRSPMVLLGRDAYGRDPSLFAVLRDQARRFGQFDHLVTLVDDPADALDFIQANEPAEAASALGGSSSDILDFIKNERTRAR
jgi:predicted Rossmann-fold nucleotide-binding protein